MVPLTDPKPQRVLWPLFCATVALLGLPRKGQIAHHPHRRRPTQRRGAHSARGAEEPSRL